MTASRVQNLLLAVLCLLVALAWMTRPGARPAPGGPRLGGAAAPAGTVGTASTALEARFDALLAELRELRLALARRGGDGAGEQAAPREPLAGEAPAGTDASALLLARLERLVAATAPGTARAPFRSWSGGAPPAPNRGAWDEYERAYLTAYRESGNSDDEKVGNRALNFLTYAEILARFGPPTSIAAKGSGQTWLYELGEHDYYVQFNDGFVTRTDF